MRIALVLSLVAACSSKDEPAPTKGTPAEPPRVERTEVEPKPVEPAAAEAESKAAQDPYADDAARMTRGSIPGGQLTPFVPDKLGGIARSHGDEKPWGWTAAYKLPDGGYANLDILATFIRATGDDSLVRLTLDSPKLCPKKEKVSGETACVRVQADRTTLFWYLPDRLTVTLSSPTEALARKMAADLPIRDLAKLSAKR